MTEATTAKDTSRLVEECQGLVRHLAQQVRSRTPAWIETDDLISYGQVGLLQAAKDFDPERGVKFSTFAFYRIRGAIFDGINKLTWFKAVKDPGIKYEQMADAVIEEFQQESAGAIGDNDLARETGWFSQIAGSLAVVYLAVADDKQTTEVADNSAAPPWSGLINTETSLELKAAVEKLPDDAAALIRAVYYEDRTLQEAADRLGISKSWASRMHARALEQLARSLKESNQAI